MYADWRCISVWIDGLRNTNSNILLTWIVLKPNAMYTMFFSNIQCNIMIVDCTRGNMGNCHPSKTYVDRSESIFIYCKENALSSTLSIHAWNIANKALNNQSINQTVSIHHGFCTFSWNLLSFLFVDCLSAAFLPETSGPGCSKL